VSVCSASWSCDADLPRIRAAVLETKTQIGLGVLGIPSVLDTLGLGPGLTLIVVIGIITTWSDYVIGVFKRHHPEVYTLAE
jgi:amino acid permease